MFKYQDIFRISEKTKIAIIITHEISFEKSIRNQGMLFKTSLEWPSQELSNLET